MKKVILLRYGEIHLKGKNRGFFENALIKNIEEVVASVDEKAKVRKASARYLVFNFEEENLSTLVDRISKVFGLVSLSVVIEIESKAEVIINVIKELIDKGEFGRLESAKTFKIDVNRADKTFPLKSNELERVLGGVVLDFYPHLKVNLTAPEETIYVDIRENGRAFIFSNKIQCVGGMPVGTSGKALVMLSGGIDSPVATYMMAKRGMKISAVHFHSYPYTSEQAKQKVFRLAEILTQYTGKMNLYCLSFTKIQEEIHKNCKESYMIAIMRRIMMRVCEKLAEKYNFQAVITGENLGQVASQTVESMISTESVLNNIPVFRPVIGFDKQEIVEIAQKIGTFETSIQPYEDCCTVFLPKSPIIKPKLVNVEKEESKIDIESLVEEALNGIELIKIEY